MVHNLFDSSGHFTAPDTPSFSLPFVSWNQFQKFSPAPGSAPLLASELFPSSLSGGFALTSFSSDVGDLGSVSGDVDEPEELDDAGNDVSDGDPVNSWFDFNEILLPFSETSRRSAEPGTICTGVEDDAASCLKLRRFKGWNDSPVLGIGAGDGGVFLAGDSASSSAGISAAERTVGTFPAFTDIARDGDKESDGPEASCSGIGGPTFVDC